jgi:hypothetical protein
MLTDPTMRKLIGQARIDELRRSARRPKSERRWRRWLRAR